MKQSHAAGVIRHLARPNLQCVRVGRIVDLDAEGWPMIDYAGNSAGPVAARTLVEISEDAVGQEVVLLFESSEPPRPIVVGFLLPSPRSKQLERIQARRVVIDSEDELVLQNGEASITLRDGKVFTRGVNIESHAKRTNKLRGASIKIN